MLTLNPHIYRIDDLLYRNGKYIHLYLADSLFEWNRTDDNHMLKKWSRENESCLIVLIEERIYACNQYYYVTIYEKIPSIHFHNVNNLIHPQLVDNDKN